MATGSNGQHTLSERLHDAREKVSHVFDDATSRASKMASRAKDVASSKASSASGLMREHPIATIAIGLGIGYLAAMILRRR